MASTPNKSLKVLCPQEYAGSGEMVVVPCTRCGSGWDLHLKRCTITTGAENMPQVADPPACPIVVTCQHGIQAAPGACAVRLTGQVCESALRYAGADQDLIDRLGFNADYL